jgi:hypothetical protein
MQIHYIYACSCVAVLLLSLQANIYEEGQSMPGVGGMLELILRCSHLQNKCPRGKV